MPKPSNPIFSAKFRMTRGQEQELSALDNSRRSVH